MPLQSAQSGGKEAEDLHLGVTFHLHQSEGWVKPIPLPLGSWPWDRFGQAPGEAPSPGPGAQGPAAL